MIAPAFLLIMQVGLNPAFGKIPEVPEELRNRPRLAPSHVEEWNCTPDIQANAGAVIARARSLAQKETGTARLVALQCKGMAEAELGQYDAAAATFAGAAESAPDAHWRGMLEGQRGYALEAAGHAQEAAPVFDTAINALLESGDTLAAGEIAGDRAVAQLHGGDTDAAAQILADARIRMADSPRIWLLCATLARRQGDLVTAQADIERAADLAPSDPRIGLEAGVIAALDGRDVAARQSFRSVIAQPGAGSLADSARAYLAQIGDGLEQGR